MLNFRLQPLLYDPFSSKASSGSVCSMDWKETAEAHIFQFDLPGASKEDVKLQVQGGRVLHLSANRKGEDGEEGGGCRWHCKERIGETSLYREFELPENALVDLITASMRDGVLVVRVPIDQLKKKKRSNVKAVEISGDAHHSSSSSNKGLSRFVCCKA